MDKSRILIVEDDEHIGSALTIRMKNAGYHTLRASDGAAGLALALDKKPDLIITDIKMPVGNGLSLAYRIQESGLHIPMIFITASREPGLREKSHAQSPPMTAKTPPTTSTAGRP